MSDIVERLRERAEINRQCGNLATAAVLDEAAFALSTRSGDLEEALRQRDEARREICDRETTIRCEYGIEPTDEQSIAAERGWEYLYEEGDVA